MKTILGIDIGTSGTKTILVDDQGRVIAAKTIEYPMETPKPGWTQQNPQDWWAASVESIRAVLAKANVPAQDIAAIGLSGQMHGMVALDEYDQVVRPAILWNDQRTEKQCEEITEAAGGLEELLKLTNNRMLTGYTGGKILWMKENEPENFAKTRVILNPKDYIRFMLTGEKATEVADASGTGFFDVKNRVFSDELIAKLGLPRSLFPRCYESYEVAGTVTEEVAKLTGLRAGLPVTAGGGDAVIQTTGTGLRRGGDGSGRFQGKQGRPIAGVLQQRQASMARHGRDAGGGRFLSLVSRYAVQGRDGGGGAHRPQRLRHHGRGG